jgi:peptide/nickel transport system substrate-binding protein
VTKRYGRTAMAALSTIVMLVGIAACGGDSGETTTGGDSDGILRWGSSTKPASLDPRKSATFDPIFLLEVYDPLIRRDAQGELQPSLATEWNLAEDARTLELTLREGVKFQDGADFNAEAVKANIDAGRAPGSNLTASLSVVESVDVVDATHVTLNLNTPSSHILNVLAGEAGMMISPDALNNEDLATKPVGAGPFTVTTYNQSTLVYEKFDDYWDADNIKLQRIEMTFLLDEETRLRALTSGQVDAAPIRSNQKEQASAANLEFTEGEAAFLYGLMLNTSRSELGNPLVRRALIHAVDREAINQAFFDGDCAPVVQPFPSSHWAHVDGLEESAEGRYDPALAKQLLAQAGLPNGFELNMFMGTAPTFQSVAQAIQAQLGQVGIKVNLTAMENTALATARRKGEFESSFASIQSGRPDPSQFAVDFYTPNGVFNPGKATIEGVDAPLQRVRETADADERAAAMSEIVTTALKVGPPMTPVCSALVVWAHTDKVKGLEIAVNYDYDFRSVSMAE